MAAIRIDTTATGYYNTDTYASSTAYSYNIDFDDMVEKEEKPKVNNKSKRNIRSLGFIRPMQQRKTLAIRTRSNI